MVNLFYLLIAVLPLENHWYEIDPSPAAATASVAEPPTAIVAFCGWVVMLVLNTAETGAL